MNKIMNNYDCLKKQFLYQDNNKNDKIRLNEYQKNFYINRWR